MVFAPDLAVVLGIEELEAVRSIRAGRFGPYFEVHGNPAVLRRDLIEALSRRADHPEGAGKEVLP